MSKYFDTLQELYVIANAIYDNDEENQKNIFEKYIEENITLNEVISLINGSEFESDFRKIANTYFINKYIPFIKNQITKDKSSKKLNQDNLNKKK